MDKFLDLVKMLLLFALICAPVALYIIKARKKQREAAEQEKARQEALRREQEAREAELKRQKEEYRRAREEADRIRREELDAAYAAYDNAVAAMEVYPVAVSATKAKKIGASFVDDLTYSTITKKSDMAKLGDFVAVDTETTGLKYTSDGIVEIAAIRFRGFRPVAKFSTLLDPGKPIPEPASSVNHITDDMVQGKPCFQEVAVSFLEFIGGDNLVGHNLPFDLKFIVRYGADVTQTKRKYFDTLALAQRTVKKVRMKWDKELESYVEDMNSDGVPDYKLETLRTYLGIVARESHRAEADALTAGFLFEKLAQIRTD